MPILIRARFQLYLQNFIDYPTGYHPFHEQGFYLHYIADSAPASWPNLAIFLGNHAWLGIYWLLGATVGMRSVSCGPEGEWDPETDFPDGRYTDDTNTWMKTSSPTPHYPGIVLNFEKYTGVAGRRGRGSTGIPYVQGGHFCVPSHFYYKVNHVHPYVIQCRNFLKTTLEYTGGNILIPAVWSRADGEARAVINVRASDYLGFHHRALNAFVP